MNNIIQTIRHTARAAAVLLIALLAAQTAWAQEDVSDADGLAEAFSSQGVSEINVTADITGVGDLSLFNDLTINLNGHTISGDYLHFNDAGRSLTINGGGQDGSVGNIISAYADYHAIHCDGTVTLSHVNITTNFDLAIWGFGTLNIGNNVSFNGWTVMPFDTPNVKIIEGGNYNYDPRDPFANVVATVTVEGTDHYFENIDAALAYIVSHPDNDHFSLSGDTYTIHTATGWDAFCYLLAESDKGFFSGKTVKLGADIGTADAPVTRMAGSPGHDFTGTFDGQDYTLTFSATAAENYCAPFRFVEGTSESHAVIRNLNVATTITSAGYRHAAGLIALQGGYVDVINCNATVNITSTIGANNDTELYPAALVSQVSSGSQLNVSGCTTNGTVSTDGKYAGGMISIVQGAASVTDCRSSVTINSSTSGDGAHGGIIAALTDPNSTTTIAGTVFDGSLLGPSTNSVGGFIGIRNSAAAISNSLFAPAEVTVSNVESATFSRNMVDTYNCYYTYLLCDGTNYKPGYDEASSVWRNGKACHSVTAGDGVTLALSGTATEYATSGITAYEGNQGIKYGTTYYAGSGDEVSLTLTTSAQCDQPGYQYTYTASAGTLSGTTLTMPDQDVTISVNTAELAPIDWATVNQGNSADDPYMIYNKDQLLLLAHRVNGTNGETAVENGYQYKYFKLGADITFDHPVAEPDNYAENYEAIGGNIGGTDRYFKGNFDGDGHTVSGIRIRKTGSGDANSFQGLFGHIDGGANIHDVHLTDARITGYENVGGIAGLNYGTVSGCSVTDSYITATGNWICGTICGDNYGTLRNNYYHGCTVNGTAVTSGEGCLGADITDNNGALPAYRLDLGANITTPPGTFAGQTGWLDTPPVGARLAPENGFTLAGNHYFASGYEFTPGSTLASGAAQGYTPRAILGDQLLDLYTPTGDAPDYTGTAIARLTITADCDRKTLAAALRSDGLEHDVSYMTADGNTQTAQAVALDGTEKSLAAGWYFVGQPTVAFDHTLNLGGDVNLILVDGNTMKVTTKTRDGISAEGHSLHIYGQTEGTGAINAQTNGKTAVVIRITNGTLGIHGGNVKANAKSTVSVESAIRVERATAGDALVIDRGTLTASSNSSNSNSSCGIYIEGGDVRINGGQVTATGPSLGIDISDYEDEDDESLTIPGTLTLSGGTLTASSFNTRSGESYAGTLAIAPGHTYTDGTSLYDSTTETATLAALGGKTLQPCLALANAADNTAAIADHAGQTLAVALSGRTLYKDGAWNTLCLPFSVTTASGTLSGDNVQAMTLDTETSNLADGTLTLNFDDATGQTIPAGMPFIIKWDNTGVNITNPVFDGVTVSNATNDATVEDVLTFTGTYAPVRIGSEGDNTKLYLGAANKLYYPNAAMTIGTHRAYFQLAEGITAGEPASLVRAFNLNFGDDEATGIISVHDSGFTVNGSDAWYTLDGRRLDGQPTAKGLYIHGGKKVAIK